MADTILIPLTRGKVAVIDATDAHLAQFKWHAIRTKGDSGPWYAARSLKIPRRHYIYLHRAILGLTDRRIQVDHINGDGLDCRRSNLRLATNGENMRNVGLRADNTSGFKGVYLHRRSGKWCARITKDGVTLSLGLHETAADAHAAYVKAGMSVHAEFFRPR